MGANYQIKINECVRNAEEKLNSAELLANSGDYKTACSILVTAYEERVKAIALQLIDLGFSITDNINDIDYLFKHHDLRHYIGYFIDCLSEIFKDFQKIVELIKANPEPKLLFQLLNDPSTLNEFSNWLLIKINLFIEKIDFYRNIENYRQMGLYVDVVGHGKPNKNLTKDEYEFIKDKLNSVHQLSYFLHEFKPMTIEESKQLEKINTDLIDEQVPIKIKETVDLVKQEKKKLFNKIEGGLFEIKEMLEEMKSSGEMQDQAARLIQFINLSMGKTINKMGAEKFKKYI